MEPEEDGTVEDFSQKKEKIGKTKEEILDETFKKAELSKGFPPKKEEKKIVKKPFRKIGIILIIIAIISLAIINYLPWVYIEYDAEYGSVKEFFYKDFENKEGNDYSEIDHIFESLCTNCSNNSQNYIGVTKDDFIDISKTTSYGFITLALLGIIFTIFEIIERMRNFSMEIVTVIHSTFAAAAIIVGIVVALSSIKFLGSYFLLYYNRSFIETADINNVILLFFVPIILIVIAFVIIKIATTVLKINFNEFEKKLEADKPEQLYSTFRYRSDM
jgi:hypothetical protein